MSVDTRTPRTPTGDRSSGFNSGFGSGFDSGFDDAPALSMVKVPSDPAQIIVNHVSFRVRLGSSARRSQSPRISRHPSAAEDTARIPVVGTAGRAGAASGARRRPVVWSGQTAPDDTGAHRLLQAVRAGSVGHGEPVPADATQVIPRVGDGYGGGGGYAGDGYDGGLAAQTLETPVVGAQRAPVAGENRLLPNMRTVGSAYDEPAYDQPAYDDAEFEDFGDPIAEADGEPRSHRRQAYDPARHAYFPGRRMNLGVVLLPLRVFLGFISVYAGMGKLCDPVYFDGGKRGSMVKWLNTLHPWEVAEPLRQLALQHPVGSGLVIAFLQVVVGVLTVLGCWQRVAAVVGALLSAALIVTVSWKTVPVYDTPDIIYLAAWSPLIIAGAPVYSIDGRLAAGAWRRLGPRADLWELRRYVLRRGALVTAIAVGLTLLVGSLLGGAVRSADRVVVPGPGEAPRNQLPGSPLPEESGTHRASSSEPAASTAPTESTPTAEAAPTAGTDSAPAARDTGTGGATAGAPSQTQGSAGQAPPPQPAPVEQAPSTSAGPTSGGADASGGAGGGAEEGGSSTSSGQPGLVGGLLG